MPNCARETTLPWQKWTISCKKQPFHDKIGQFPAGNDSKKNKMPNFPRETTVSWQEWTISCKKRLFHDKIGQFPTGNDSKKIEMTNFPRETTYFKLKWPISRKKRHQRIALDQFFMNNDVSESRWTNISFAFRAPTKGCPYQIPLFLLILSYWLSPYNLKYSRGDLPYSSLKRRVK